MDETALAPALPLGEAARRAAPAARAWRARLELGLERRGAGTVVAHRRHRGPLRLQKALYPEGAELAHLLVIHPPAGIAGGDHLEIDARLAAGCQALVTTPGAAKWYRSAGSGASQSTVLEVGEGAALEWLPQEAIFFDGADATLETSVHCAHGARVIGWEIMVFGRKSAGEAFRSGRLAQQLSLFAGERLLWRERTRLDGGDALFASPVGWDGAHVSGVMWVYATLDGAALIEHWRTLGEPGVRFGCTQLDERLLLVRALAHSPERLRALFERLWCAARVPALARPANRPRIWST